MVTTCAVVGCNSSWNPFTGVTFHRITTNKKVLPLWRKVVKINKSENGQICSLHFRQEDFVEIRGEKRLKRLAVPSFNIIDKASDTDDDDDNRNLSTLKKLLSSSQNVNGNNEDTSKRSQDFIMVMPCCTAEHSNSPNVVNSKETRNTGSQVSIKTDREVALQSRVKLLNLRLRRRDAKLCYMKTVFNMIKKHVKGTDMEYKLCCELENISKFSEPETIVLKNNVSKKQIRVASPIRDHDIDDEINDDASSGDETGGFVEVTLSPNLRVFKGS